MLLQLATFSGAVAGVGALLVARELLPAAPDLTSALARLTTQQPAPAPADLAEQTGSASGRLQGRLGQLLHDRLADHRLGRLPSPDLQVLALSPQAWFGQKALFALIGLAFPALMATTVTLVGAHLPWALPVAASLALAGALWFVPDLDVRARAATARAEFARAVTAYIDLSALERAGGTGTTQSLENAAQIGGSWVFERIRAALHRSRWSGATPWQALSDLSEQVGVPELEDLADIMRLSGEEGVAVYDNLRSRSRSMRTALLAREQARANADSEQMVVPVAILGLLFLCLLAYPAIVRVL